MQAGKKITVAEFEAFIDLPENQERRFELIDGEIVERIRDWISGIIRADFAMWIGTFVEAHNLGRVVLPAYCHAANDDYNDLLPDLAFTGNNRLLPLVDDGAVLQVPDLAVEIQAPSDALKQLRAKADYYLAHGSRMVLLVIPKKRLVEVITADDVQILDEHDTFDGGDVLPGFTLAVRDIFDIE